MEIKPQHTLLIVPPNDEEAYLIAELAERKGYQVYRSTQPHGARLEREPALLEQVERSGASQIIIVEMPGPPMEERIRAMGKHLVIIDHHNYTDLDRAHHSKTGDPLPSSLEQFLSYADITDEWLLHWKYDPKMVRAIGLWDAGYIWALIDAGFSKQEIEIFLAYKDELARSVGSSEIQPRNQLAARRAFEEREAFGSYTVMVGHDPVAHIRSSVSRLMAMEYWKPMPAIISERAGERLYVQETDQALNLFHRFGGFTFGTDRNWGYDNTIEATRVTLSDTKAFLEPYV
ncbi:MAG: hypothetical protein UY95_C0024G0006 [Parcubacteria group bacterium GW2011_GWA2_56_7]|nr:MAG: hypothetical protein UY95_C0024G0006 [Parcubacteria group bacterium GW2011_GWA2_56_7]